MHPSARFSFLLLSITLPLPWRPGAAQLTPKAAPVRRAAVVGGGLGGLSFAKSLEVLNSHVEEVSIFERREKIESSIGGGVQLSGGAAVLEKLGLSSELRSFANPLERVLSRTVEEATLLDLDIPAALRRRPEAARALVSEDGTRAYAVMRDALQLMLRQSLERTTVELGKELIAVDTEADGTISLTFQDATVASGFDLVVAADGIGANAMRMMGGERTAVYSGKRIQFGVVEQSRRAPQSRRSFHQWFSQGVYGLCGTYGGTGGDLSDMIALVFRGESTDENPDWDVGNVQSDCLARLKENKMPKEMIDLAANADRFFELGVFFHLPRLSWRPGKSRVVLLGDAAHAMPPFLGQGANQAIQDAYCLAAEIKKVNEGIQSVDEALSQYESIRKPPTAELLLKSAFLGELETLPGELSRLRNAFFAVTGRLGIAERVFVDGALPRIS